MGAGAWDRVGLSRDREEGRGRGDALGGCRDAGGEGKASAGFEREGLTQER